MVQIESLSKGNQYNDLRILFPSLLDKDEDGKYIGLPLASNHITINGINHYWNDGGFGRAYDESKKEDARIKLYPNSFELIVNDRRRIICHPQQIKSLFVLCNGALTKDGYNSHYHISWG